jgi:peptide/nickel transport system ATP-binding protein
MSDMQNQISGSPARIVVRNLAKYFDVSTPLLSRLINGQDRSVVKAVDDISLSIPRGTTFSLVGESGCGKSTIARLVIGLYQPTNGSVEYDGTPVHLGKIGHGAQKRMQMIFQDPFASLNPRWRVRDIIAEPLIAYGLASDRQSLDRRVGELLEVVNLTVKDGNRYPHEFSGGQRQRISIARALASNPEFLVCDEPTSALDVSVQAQILNLMKDLQQEFGLTYLFISHDLAVVHHISDYVGIMYLGRLVETGPAAEIFANPLHPYTRLLLQAIPDLKMEGRGRTPLRGEVPSPMSPPAGCHFHPRCPIANDRCRIETPRSIGAGGERELRCHAAEEGRLQDFPQRLSCESECVR